MTITTKLKIGLIVLLPYLYIFPSAAQTDKDYPWMQYYDQLIELEDIDDENIETHTTYSCLFQKTRLILIPPPERILNK